MGMAIEWTVWVGNRGWCEVQVGRGEGGLEVCDVRKGGVV